MVKIESKEVKTQAYIYDDRICTNTWIPVKSEESFIDFIVRRGLPPAKNRSSQLFTSPM